MRKGGETLYFFDGNSGKAKKVVVQVKGGHHTVSQIRDLKGVMERDKAEIGVFITLQAPTKPMLSEAAAAGFYEPPVYIGKSKYPKLQILTIEELLNGKQLEMPRFHVDTFKKAELKGKVKYERMQLIED
jgi:site-specific DNA-methyltransferase (adenine-specific)